MATIRREYDDSEVLGKLQEVKEGLNIPDLRWVKDIDVEPASYGAKHRVITVELHIPVTTDEFGKIFATPNDLDVAY